MSLEAAVFVQEKQEKWFQDRVLVEGGMFIIEGCLITQVNGVWFL